VTEKGRPLITISGTPGTGKSAVAQALGSRLGLPVIALNELVRERGLGRGSYDGSMVVDEAGVREALEAIDKPSIVEGHFADLAPAGRVSRLFVLRCRPRELADRLAPRDYSLEKLRENILAEGLDACLIDAVTELGEERVSEADTTGRCPEDVAAELERVLRGELIPPVPGRFSHIEEAIEIVNGLGGVGTDVMLR
jgi:adenylate kinase